MDFRRQFFLVLRVRFLTADLQFPWRTGNLLVSLLVLSPLFALLWLATTSTHSNMVLQNIGWYLGNTLLLLIGVGIVTLSIGIVCGYLIAHYTFPLSRQLSWALLLPLALPGYIAAYIYTDLLAYAGPVQSFLRGWFGFTSPQDYWFPAIRSLPGAALIMGLVLYPYVYLLLRSTLLEQSLDVERTARSLGMSPLTVARKVHLPLARPALIAGAALAMLEAVGDFGTVDYFAIATLLTGMYDIWQTLSDIGGAARLALMLTCTALIVLMAERYSRRQRRYYHSDQQVGTRNDTASSVSRQKPLTGWRGWLACILCALPVAFGFLIPVGNLLHYAVQYFSESFSPLLLAHLLNSLKLALSTVAVTLLFGILVVYTQRWRRENIYQYTRVLCSLGYATPGAVLAIGIVVVSTGVDKVLNQVASVFSSADVGLLLSGSLAALVLALSIRFIIICAGALEASLGNITTSTDMAARSLGHSTTQILFKFHMPLLRRGVIAAALIIFVDTMKELPATLILRPFNFDTLATHIYFLADDEQIELAALGGLAIIVPSAIAMLLVYWVGKKGE